MNTMRDLRATVAERLKETLDGSEIDMMDTVKPRVPHMLGVTELGEPHDPTNESGTLLDSQHEFWQEYEEDIETRGQVKQKIETAIRSLKDDDIFRMTHPYGEEADIVYIEVDDISADSSLIQTECRVCGSRVTTEPDLRLIRGSYHIAFHIDCNECGESETIGGLMREVMY
jgi:hypothetical protein